MLASLIRPTVTCVILLRVLRKMCSPESQTYDSVGPCTRHRELQNSEINSDQSQISKDICNISESDPSTNCLVYEILVCVDSMNIINVGSALGTEKVPQRDCVTKILPNVRVNFLVRFVSKPLFLGDAPEQFKSRYV